MNRLRTTSLTQSSTHEASLPAHDSHVENSVSVAWPDEHATTKFMIDTSNALT